MATTTPVNPKTPNDRHDAVSDGDGLVNKSVKGAPIRSAADEFLRLKIQEACQSLWWAEFTRACLQATLLLIIALGTWVIIDQWIVSPGALGRWISLGLFSGGVIFFFVQRVLPLLGQSIRPEYAARSLEKNFPELRQALTSYVTLHDQQSPTPDQKSGATFGQLQKRVVQSLGSSTAGYLKQHDELPMEATSTIRWWIATIAALAVLTIYAAISPKNALPSIARLAAPWTSIQSAKRVQISEVAPGNASATSGAGIPVMARVQGLRKGETVQCRWTLDARDHSFVLTINEELTGTKSKEHFGGNLKIPENAAGLLSYTVAAGDAVAGPYELNIKNVPVVSLQSVKYEPPAYTRESSFTRTNGAISAVDGTMVTILARTNRPMARAAIEFNPKSNGDTVQATAGAVEMHLDSSSQQISVSFPLQIPTGRSTSVLRESYRIRVWDDEGATNFEPIIYPIEIIADLAPEVAIMLPTEVPKDIPYNAQQIIAVHASDADYGLSQIRLQMRMGIQQLPDVVLWRNQTGQTGNQIAEYRFRPNRLLLSNADFLRPGQTILVSAVAIDNRRTNRVKQPIPERAPLQSWVDAGANVTVTDAIELRIVEADKLPPPNQADDQGMSQQDQRPAVNPDAGTNQNQQGGSSGSSDSGGAKQESAGQAGTESGASAGQSGQSSSDGATASGGGSGTPNEPKNDGSNPSGNLQSRSADGDPSSHDSNRQDKTSDGANSNSTKPHSTGNRLADDPPDDSKSAKQGDSNAQPADGTNHAATDSDSGSQTSNSETTKAGDSPNQGSDPRQPPDQSSNPPGTSRKTQQEQTPGTGGSKQNGATGNESSEGQQADRSQGKPQHDGQAFERIKDFIEKQKEKGQQSSGSKSGGSDNQLGDQGAATPDSSSRKNTEQTGGDPPKSSDQPSETSDGSQNPAADAQADQPSTGTAPQEKSPPGNSQISDQTQSADQSQSRGDSKAGDAAKGSPENFETTSNRQQGDSDKKNSAASGSEKQNGGSESKQTSDQSAEDKSSKSVGDQMGTPTKQATGDSTDVNDSSSASRPGKGMPGRGDAKKTVDSGATPNNPQDAVNEDYAKQATDMVLDYLDETREQPDPELLKQLDWTKQDLEQFRKRWETIRDPGLNTATDSKKREEQLDALRSLGLRPPSKVSPSKVKDRADSLGPIRDSGNRVRPPAAHRDAFDAFRRAIGAQN